MSGRCFISANEDLVLNAFLLQLDASDVHVPFSVQRQAIEFWHWEQRCAEEESLVKTEMYNCVSTTSNSSPSSAVDSSIAETRTTYLEHSFLRNCSKWSLDTDM